MDEHFQDINASQIQDEYWGNEDYFSKTDRHFKAENEALPEEYLTLFDVGLHQEYWGDDEGYLVAQHNRKEDHSIKKTKPKTSPSRTSRPFGRTNLGKRPAFGLRNAPGLFSGATQSILDQSFQSYQVNEEIDLEIVNTPGQYPATISYLRVKITKLLGTPWRSGCVMVCNCLESPHAGQVGQQYVLKIVDPRLLEALRGSVSVARMSTVAAFRRYVDMVLSGVVDEYVSQLDREQLSSNTNVSYDFEGKERSSWQAEATFYKICEIMVEEEMSAYKHLAHLQGTFIPRLIHEVRTCPWSRLAAAPFGKYFQAPGFLLECVDGVSLAEVTTMPRYFWKEIYEEATRVANLLEYYQFDHVSLSPRNLIVKHARATNGSPRVVFIDLHKHGKWSEDDGFFKYDVRFFDDMERSLYDKSQWWWGKGIDAQWFKAMFEDQIFTGRFAERGLFKYPSKLSRMNGKGEPSHEALIDCIKWRVIMDDLWHVEGGLQQIGKDMIDEKGRISRIACRIMKEEVDRPGLFYERDKWCTRALSRIADELECHHEGVVARFQKAFEEYFARPNGPEVTTAETFGDTFLAEALHGSEETAGSELMLETATVTSDYGYAMSRSSSVASTVSSSGSSLSMASSAATSVTDLSLHLRVPKKARIQIFLPKKPKRVIEADEDFGWM